MSPPQSLNNKSIISPKVKISVQLLLGGMFLFKTYKFTLFTKEKYRILAIAQQRIQEKDLAIEFIRKKVLKKAKISQEKEQIILNLSLSELQLQLLKQTISNEEQIGIQNGINESTQAQKNMFKSQAPQLHQSQIQKSQNELYRSSQVVNKNQHLEQSESNVEILTIEDVVLVYLKQIISQSKHSLYGEYNFKQVLDQVKLLNATIQTMIKFQQESSLKEKQDIAQNVLNLQQDEEIKQKHIDEEEKSAFLIDEEQEDNAPQSLNKIDRSFEQVNKKEKSSITQILEQKSLLGLIVVVDDRISVKGLQSRLGMIQEINLQQSQSSCDLKKFTIKQLINVQVSYYQKDLVEYIQSKGALILVKSNSAQGHSAIVQMNNQIWGQIFNPWNSNRIVGNSSEASLVARKFVNFAISVDQIGEQKINVAFNGVQCFSPSGLRLPWQSVNDKYNIIEQKVIGASLLPKRLTFNIQLIDIITFILSALQIYIIIIKICFCVLQTIQSDIIFIFMVFKFIGKKVEDIMIVVDQLMKDTKENKIFTNNPRSLHIPFDLDKYYCEEPLRIAYFDSQSIFESCQSVKRAILTCYGHLTSLGYEITKIQQDLPHFTRIFELSMKLYINCHFLQNKQLREEEMTSQIKSLISKIDHRFNLQQMTQLVTILKSSKREQQMRRVLQRMRTAKDIQDCISELLLLKQDAQLKLQQMYNCDIFLCPVYPLVAPLKDDYLHELLPANAYAIYWNILEMPNGIIAQGLVNHDETDYRSSTNDIFDYYAKQVMKYSAGMPISVQIVGQQNQDETVLRVMRELQDKIKFKLPNQFE